MATELITISATVITATSAGCTVNYLGCKTFPKYELAYEESKLENAMRELRDAGKEKVQGHVDASGLVATTLLINMIGTQGFVHVDPKIFVSGKEDKSFSDALQFIASSLGYRGG